MDQENQKITEPDPSSPSLPADAGAEPEEGAPPPSLPEGVTLPDLLEALVFSSSDLVTPVRLAGATGLDPGRIQEGLAELGRRLEQEDRPYRLVKVGRGYRLVTHPRYHPFLLVLKGIRREEGLSQAALETLAVIAYRQPIIRAEIEDIRGVRCGPMLRSLLERKLIKVTGRAQVPGRPLLYATSRLFLERFGLEDLKDLPSLREVKEAGGRS